MQNVECVPIKLLSPTTGKLEWLETTSCAFRHAVQIGLDSAENLWTSSRARIHEDSYYTMRNVLPSDYSRMAVNASVALARSFFKLREKQANASFPHVNGFQGIGLGVNAYKLVKSGSRYVLRVSTGERGKFVWFPLCSPEKFQDRLDSVKGDARLFKVGKSWFVALPVKAIPPTGCSGERTFIGVDLGIVRIATVATPNGPVFFSGKAIRNRREHFKDVRKRYQRHRRTDRVRVQKGHERRWMRNENHVISKHIVDIALRYPNPVIVLEKLEGIRERLKGSKRFNRMMSSWSFRQLADMICYKAARHGIEVLFVDPRNTSKTCPKCGHTSRSNRTTQATFRCTKCRYEANADWVGAQNIAARGACPREHEPSDTARASSGAQVGNAGS